MLPGTVSAAACAFQAFPDRLAQHGQALAHCFFAQGRRADGEPRPEVGEIRAQDGVQPPGVVVFTAARDFDEVDGRMGVGADQLLMLPGLVFVPFPAARLALEIVGRQANEQHLRAAERSQDAVAPVVHVADFVNVEKDVERRRRILAMVGPDMILERGHPAMRAGLGNGPVVEPGVGDEEFVFALIGAHGDSRIGPPVLNALGERLTDVWEHCTAGVGSTHLPG